MSLMTDNASDAFLESGCETQHLWTGQQGTQTPRAIPVLKRMACVALPLSLIAGSVLVYGSCLNSSIVMSDESGINEKDAHSQGMREVSAKAIKLPAPQAGYCVAFPDGEHKTPAYSTAQAESMLKPPREDSFRSRVVKKMVESSESYGNSVSAMAKLQADGWGAQVKASLESSQETSGDSSSITFVMYAFLSSQEPTLMSACPDLTAQAKATLEKGADAFEEEYGTHFVYGYRATAYALAEVDIHVKTTSEKAEIAAELSASFTKIAVGGVEGGAAFSKAVQSTSTEKTVRARMVSSGVSGSPDSSSIEDMTRFLFKLDEHRSPDSARSTVIVYPHHYCLEYQSLISDANRKSSGVVSDFQDKLFTSWAEVRYVRASFDRVLRSGPRAFAAATASGLNDKILEIETQVLDMMSSKTLTTEEELALSHFTLSIMSLSYDVEAMNDDIFDDKAIAFTVSGTQLDVNGEYFQNGTKGNYTRFPDRDVVVRPADPNVGWTIRPGDNGGWDFCPAVAGVVIEPCWLNHARVGWVDGDAGKPKAGEVFDWGRSGRSVLS